MTNGGRLAIVAGMIVMGLSPSFVDWQQSPELRPQMYMYYGVSILLIVFGLWDGD